MTSNELITIETGFWVQGSSLYSVLLCMFEIICNKRKKFYVYLQDVISEISYSDFNAILVMIIVSNNYEAVCCILFEHYFS